MQTTLGRISIQSGKDESSKSAHLSEVPNFPVPRVLQSHYLRGDRVVEYLTEIDQFGQFENTDARRIASGPERFLECHITG